MNVWKLQRFHHALWSGAKKEKKKKKGVGTPHIPQWNLPILHTIGFCVHIALKSQSKKAEKQKGEKPKAEEPEAEA